MKHIYIFASRLLAFWVLIPMSVIMTLSLRYNEVSEHWLKLYPLIIFSIGAIVFTFIYLFRFISISYSEIKYIGRFTSRDSATINEGKTLVIEMLPKRKISIRLYGNEGYNPEIKWLTDENGEVSDICLFRGKAYGGESVAVRILCHFGVNSAEDIDAILNQDSFEKPYENVSICSLIENENRQIKIRFDKTV